MSRFLRLAIQPEQPNPAALSRTVAATFQRAEENAGGRRSLARLLNVSMADLERWMHGNTRLPSYVFLRALDLAFSGTLPVAPRRRMLSADEDE